MDERVEISHRLFVEHSQYFVGSPLPYGVGTTPHEALDDALDQCGQSCEYIAERITSRYAPAGEECDPKLVRDAIDGYKNEEPDEPGELATIEGWDADGSEVYWHCVLSFEHVED
jgi:hypothetical protein